MEDFLNIKAESRQEVGKKIAKKLRKEGKIPAIIYGDHKESIPISLAAADIKAIMKSEKRDNTVLHIQRDDIEVNAMLKELQYDYLSETIIHVDFLRIDLEKPVNVSVPIDVQGEPIGVKMEDGLFDFQTREIRIRCLPALIPVKYELDVSEMHSGQSVKADDIELGENIKLMSDPHTVICAVITKRAAEEEEIAEEEVLEGEEGAEETPAAEGETKSEE